MSVVRMIAVVVVIVVQVSLRRTVSACRVIQNVAHHHRGVIIATLLVRDRETINVDLDVEL